jgi:tetratricopeptide (TPR) repeat protein
MNKPVRPVDAMWLAVALAAWMSFVWPVPPALADAAAGRAAYDRGDYAGALADWQRAADAGDPDAQFGLGRLYEYGLAGLRQDYKLADHWYELAAAQDDNEAIYRLALIWAVGNPDFPSDPVEAYKWATLAAGGNGGSSPQAAELRARLDQIVTPAQQTEARQRVSAWHEAASQQKQAATAAPQTAQPTDGTTQLDALNNALSQLTCSAVTAELSRQGEGPRLSGVVPDADAKAQLMTLAGRYFPNKPPEMDVVVSTPSLCRSFAALALLRREGLVTEGELQARLVSGDGLREGDLIKIEVHAPAWVVSLRIDYFSLDGQVQHLWPNDEESEAKLTTGATRIFGDGTRGKIWKAGGAPFGTESIAVIATPQPLNLGAARPVVENGAAYLRDAAAALAQSKATDKPNLLATILVTTHAR